MYLIPWEKRGQTKEEARENKNKKKKKMLGFLMYSSWDLSTEKMFLDYSYLSQSFLHLLTAQVKKLYISCFFPLSFMLIYYGLRVFYLRFLIIRWEFAVEKFPFLESKSMLLEFSCQKLFISQSIMSEDSSGLLFLPL